MNPTKPTWRAVKRAVTDIIETQCPDKRHVILSIASRLYSKILPSDQWWITYDEQTGRFDVVYSVEELEQLDRVKFERP